jgi:hypothetical protein
MYFEYFSLTHVLQDVTIELSYDKVKLGVWYLYFTLLKTSNELFFHVKSFKSLKYEKFHKCLVLIQLKSTQKTTMLGDFMNEWNLIYFNSNQYLRTNRLFWLTFLKIDSGLKLYLYI